MKVGKNKILVVVPPEEDFKGEEMTKSGIVLTSTEVERKNIKGRVAAIGEGVKGIESGDEILIFGVYKSQVMEYDGFRYCFVDYESSFYIKL